MFDSNSVERSLNNFFKMAIIFALIVGILLFGLGWLLGWLLYG